MTQDAHTKANGTIGSGGELHQTGDGGGGEGSHDRASAAPTAGGVTASDGSWIDADHKMDGGPSVQFDAVAVQPLTDGAEALTGEATARDFAADAFAHRKYAASVPATSTLFEKAGTPAGLDDGFVDVTDGIAPERFIETCRTLRHRPRETAVKLI